MHSAPIDQPGQDATRWSQLRLECEDFVLRRWCIDDLESLLRHADDERVVAGLSDRFPSPYTRSDGEHFLSGRVVDLSHPVLAIECDGQACGGIGARPGMGERRHSAELGYWLGRQYWGRGLMTRVVRLYADWAMQALRLYRLGAHVLDSNPASARVLLKNGFSEEGTLRCALVKHGRVHDLRSFARIAPPG
ncbi:GNAT family protein [Pseudoxanthomonas sp.]|uniref:GNAT family N-acetyltransferase n=1 Tax=Pseudoxanthomonas sp. TaxID=1871049 RepID=UPI00261BE983|nr:GNAT family protein [Pseudoxanthomonas sp.]WDS35796.1 MAG: GNAT family protein [Pseudoxanthomonas sp.]